MEFTLLYWINDPNQGQGNLRSDINLALLQNLRQRGIAVAAPPRAATAPGSANPAPLV
jgi:small-conductance mechanosensitive channel